MNSKMKWMQLIGLAALVALASVFVTGPVAADTPPVNTDQIRQIRMAQYRDALKQMERDHDWEHFVQYLTAIEQSAYSTAPANTGSRQNADIYRGALKQVEQDHDWERFIQVLEGTR